MKVPYIQVKTLNELVGDVLANPVFHIRQLFSYNVGLTIFRNQRGNPTLYWSIEHF